MVFNPSFLDLFLLNSVNGLFFLQLEQAFKLLYDIPFILKYAYICLKAGYSTIELWTQRSCDLS